MNNAIFLEGHDMLVTWRDTTLELLIYIENLPYIGQFLPQKL